jgi:serine/threonine-protein kinase
MGAQFDKGGMGRVFDAIADDGSPAVIKLVPKDPKAARELLFEDLSGTTNVIPILDSGEWEDFWVLVMPRADRSLAQHLAEAGGRLVLDEAIPVLIDIAEALAALRADVVHRDVKPDNILLYEGKWCLADFGIARYAEAATATETNKFKLTAPYAAPEQWKLDHATHATDVYAFGVVAFELTQGALPFPGPEVADWRRQHLEDVPPDLAGTTPSFSSIVVECLTKLPQARPNAANLLSRLKKIGVAATPGAIKLQEIQKRAAERQALETAIAAAQETRDQERAQLFDVAKQSLHNVILTLRDAILEEAPLTRTIDTNGPMRLELEKAALIVDPPKGASFNCLSLGDSTPFDVIAHSAIAVEIEPDKSGYTGRSHSLWYCDAHRKGEYRWFELAFMMRPSAGASFKSNPAALGPDTANAKVALSHVTGSCQIAREPVPIDQGEEPVFIERWLNYFAEGAGGTLIHPRILPEDTGGRRRTGQ